MKHLLNARPCPKHCEGGWLANSLLAQGTVCQLKVHQTGSTRCPFLREVPERSKNSPCWGGRQWDQFSQGLAPWDQLGHARSRLRMGETGQRRLLPFLLRRDKKGGRGLCWICFQLLNQHGARLVCQAIWFSERQLWRGFDRWREPC